MAQVVPILVIMEVHFATYKSSPPFIITHDTSTLSHSMLYLLMHNAPVTMTETSYSYTIRSAM